MVKFRKMFSKKGTGLQDHSSTATTASKSTVPTSPKAAQPSTPVNNVQPVIDVFRKPIANQLSTKETRDEIFENRDACDPDSDREDEPTENSLSMEDEDEPTENGLSMEEESVESTQYENDETTYMTYGDETAAETHATSVGSGTYDNDDDIVQSDTYDGSVAASSAVGNQKKFFHKDVVLHHFGENGMCDNLVIRAMYFVPKPKNADHVVVRIEASTVSARDVTACKGIGINKMSLPFVPGFEVIGTIQTMGENAKGDGHFKEGDRVAGISTFGGGNSRFISLPASRLCKISSTIKSTTAVCLIHDYMTALKALRLAKKSGSPFTGMNILITDGFSPIGQAAITLANMEGANIYCCADESKHAYLATLGAKCFPKEPEAWLPNASGTFDVVIDNSCYDSYSSSWFALNQNGTLVCTAPVYSFDTEFHNGCGVIDLKELQTKWAALKAKYMMTQTAFVNTVSEYEENPEQYRQDLRYLSFLLEKGDISPKIAEKVSLEDVPDAQRLLYSGKANGTLVCVPWIEN